MAPRQNTHKSGRLEPVSTVSGLPLFPVRKIPVISEFHQQQFPPPIPQSYLPYGGGVPVFGRDYPPPPSPYYTRYPNPVQQITGVPNTGLYGVSVQEEEEGQEENYGRVYTVNFDEESIRESFVQTVLFWIGIQLTVIVLFSLLCLETKSVRHNVVEENKWLLGLSFCLCFFIFVTRWIYPKGIRRRPMDILTFLVWSIAVMLTLTWIVVLLEFHYLMVTLILLLSLVLSILISTYIFARNLLSFRSSLICGVVFVIVSILLLTIYHQSTPTVLFAGFSSIMVLMFLFFRLHYLMGDENRKLEPTETFHAATCILI
eukprot:g4268.t1